MPTYYDRSLTGGGAIGSRRQSRVEGSYSAGPHEAVVESNVDYTRHGRLRVSIQGSQDTRRDTPNGQISVRVMLPYYSNKDYEVTGSSPDKYEDTQQGFGMVFPAPQVGTRGLVLLIDGKLSQAVWIGALPEENINHALPDYAASENISADGATIKEYSPTNGLPVGDINTRAFVGQEPDPDRMKKPIHPFSNVLRTQGLLADSARGISTSSHRRDLTPRLFGINTPGAWGETERLQGPQQVKTKVTKLGGHVFVMDDGDAAGKNNLVRLRSRAGHQILLNDTDDLIYIGNSKGTAWIELTKDGKIDIFATDSVSVHTKNDFNFFADRDINFEAKRNINIKAHENSQFETLGNHTFIVDGNGKLEIRGDTEFTTTDYKVYVKDYDLTSENFTHSNFINTKIRTSNYDLHTAMGIRQSAGDGIELKANTAGGFAETFNPELIYQQGYTVTAYDSDNDIMRIYRAVQRTWDTEQRKKIAPGDANFWQEIGATGSGVKAISLQTSGGDINIKTDATVWIDGDSAVRLNEPGAATATAASTAQASPTSHTRNLSIHGNPDTDPTTDWANWTHYQVETPLKSIMKRIPVHEPWKNHENVNYTNSKPNKTDREVE